MGAGRQRIVRWKVEPSPAALSAHMRPPRLSASRRLMASPSPCPVDRVVEESAWLNGLNRRSIRSWGMPIRCRGTAKWRIANSSSVGSVASRRTSRRISPRAVNLTALPSRLTRIWRSRAASLTTAAGTSSAIQVWRGQALARRARREEVQRLAESPSAGRRARPRSPTSRPRPSRGPGCRSGSPGARCRCSG